jgi:transposase
VKVLPAAVRRRDAAIVAAVDAGYSLRAVGDAAGLSHVAILRIVRRYVRPTAAG